MNRISHRVVGLVVAVIVSQFMGCAANATAEQSDLLEGREAINSALAARGFKTTAYSFIDVDTLQALVDQARAEGAGGVRFYNTALVSDAAVAAYLVDHSELELNANNLKMLPMLMTSIGELRDGSVLTHAQAALVSGGNPLYSRTKAAVTSTTQTKAPSTSSAATNPLYTP